MKEATKEREVVDLDMSIVKEIDGQIDEYYTEKVLDKQLDILADEIVNKEEKKYSGMDISNEFEDYLKEKCLEYAEKYNLDYDTLYKVIMTIGYRESDGKWDNSGKVSDTKDYGFYQINECNLKDAKESKNYTKDDILYDDYKNADYAIYHVCKIMMLDSCKEEKDIYGIYNGWIDYRKSKSAVNYANACMEIENTFFNNNVINK